MPAKKKQVATKKDQLPANIDFGNDFGAGMENVDESSFAIPFLRVLQSNSPQVNEDEPEYIEGAKAGMFFNTVTNQLFDGRNKGVVFLACAFKRAFIHWGPRGADEGGFKGEMSPEEAAKLEANGTVVNEKGRLVYPKDDGTVDSKKCDFLSDTRSHFGLIIHDDGLPERVLLALSSTQIKKSKQLMTMLNNVKVTTKNGMQTPPTWLSRIRLKSVPESNSEGNWYGVKVELDGQIDTQELYNAGREFSQLVQKGEVKVNYNEAEEAKDDPDKI